MRRAPSQVGMTMVEIMVSVGLVGIVAAFTFGVQMRVSIAMRDQDKIAELQQTLRAASGQIMADVRRTGMLATSVSNGATGLTTLGIQAADNPNGDGTDWLRVQYADKSAEAHIKVQAWNPAGSQVDQVGGFATNDIAYAVRTKDCSGNGCTPRIGTGCLLKITSISTGPPVTFNHTANTSPYNLANNSQCANISGTYASDGFLKFTKIVMRSYRIKPNDPRGVLQMSPSGGDNNATDWEDMALGVVDLQVAIRVFQPGDATDSDGDGDPQRDWFSGANLATALTAVANSVPLQVSVTLVAKSTKEISGYQLVATPDVFEASKPLANNRIGDHAGTTLPVASTSSMYYGSNAYRMLSATVELRNLAAGFQ